MHSKAGVTSSPILLFENMIAENIGKHLNSSMKHRDFHLWRKNRWRQYHCGIFVLLLPFSYFFLSIKINRDNCLLTGVLLLQSFLRIVIRTVTFLQNFPSSLPAKQALIEKYQFKTLNISEARTFLNVLWGQEAKTNTPNTINKYTNLLWQSDICYTIHLSENILLKHSISCIKVSVLLYLQ